MRLTMYGLQSGLALAGITLMTAAVAELTGDPMVYLPVLAAYLAGVMRGMGPPGGAT